ncbi:MAG TPA: MazG nucleotide pyrophosphohydrolase domain-containing protein [Patescibacteria group bacterium]|nr:MazG nucleotide pyrophosphohydrolase domain-containing protein [Patescibacteria group bacterium]
MKSIEESNISELQSLIKKLVTERGFDKETISEVFTLLVEEIGEFAKSIRKFNGQKVDKKSKEHFIEEEAADVLWLLLDLCNRLEIDLAKAFNSKELKNQKRSWQ